jgi:phage tail sheath protein FI
VRRYSIYLERSIEAGTQWVVFENNTEPLWSQIRTTIENFLLAEWKRGCMVGSQPEQAFFVRCDRSTMKQSDLAHGRVVCVVGVALIRPAEFVILRIAQKTADATA